MSKPRKIRKDTQAKRDAELLAHAEPDDFAHAAELIDSLREGKSVTTMTLFELAAALCRKQAQSNFAFVTKHYDGDVPASVKVGIEQAKRGELVNMGAFADD